MELQNNSLLNSPNPEELSDEQRVVNAFYRMVQGCENAHTFPSNFYDRCVAFVREYGDKRAAEAQAPPARAQEAKGATTVAVTARTVTVKEQSLDLNASYLNIAGEIFVRRDTMERNWIRLTLRQIEKGRLQITPGHEDFFKVLTEHPEPDGEAVLHQEWERIAKEFYNIPFDSWKTKQQVVDFFKAQIEKNQTGHTTYGHVTLRPRVVPSAAHLVIERDWQVGYLRSEYEGQIRRMLKLGINVEDQFFEQSVNTVIAMAEAAQRRKEAPEAADEDWGNLIGRMHADYGEVPFADTIKALQQDYILIPKNPASAPRAGADGWTSEKPALNKACLLLTANYIKSPSRIGNEYWAYQLFEIFWVETEDGGYWGALKEDGEEWGDIADIKADLYQIVSLPKTPDNGQSTNP